MQIVLDERLKKHITALFAFVSGLFGIFLLLSPMGAIDRESREYLSEIRVLRRAYPGINFESAWDAKVGDWKLRIGNGEIKTELFWTKGRYLPPGLLDTKDNYRFLIYRFPWSAPDPSKFSPKEIEKMRVFGDDENRESSPIIASAFFDAIHDTSTREQSEQHIVKTIFLDRSISVHEHIVKPLERVDAHIRELAKTDATIEGFLSNIGSIEGYSWRQIRDTSGKSFHAMGLAIDIMPEKTNGRSIYWSWEKSKGNNDWMLIPLTERWMPPCGVIDAFEQEGFIWGGKWTIWDNMHFEYRPELLEARRLHGG